jgi:hypothetical protein
MIAVSVIATATRQANGSWTRFAHVLGLDGDVAAPSQTREAITGE